LKSYRQIEGKNPVREALSGRFHVAEVLLAEGLKRDRTLQQIVDLAGAQHRPADLRWVKREVIDGRAESRSHQGVMALGEPIGYAGLADIMDLADSRRQSPLVLILDRIQDPQNLGAILRVAECSGAHGVIIPKRRAAGISPTVSKASAGAIEHVPMALVTNLVRTVEELKERGLWICGAGSSQDRPYYEQDLTGPLAIVIGSEGEGIARLLLEHCDFLVGIPLAGRVESLNAATASAVITFDALRQRQTGDRSIGQTDQKG